ncbi:MAG: diguanylate cyclase [Planctomycetes bacterium]|nr:diguanylate cyclase [Planctomycetota bacterium]
MVRDGSSSGRGPLSEEARAILDASPVPALALRDDLRILHANAAAVAAFGADVERAGSLPAWLESVARGAASRSAAQRLAAALADGDDATVRRTHLRVAARDGTPVELDVAWTRSPWPVAWLLTEGTAAAGDPSHAARLAELEARVADLEREATTDRLTGAWNRRFVDRVVRGEIERSRRHRQPLTALMLDVDRFKDVNDRHGHAAGDRLLCAVANQLERRTRATDAVVRWGGDEFLLVLPATTLVGGRLLAEDLRTRIRALELEGDVRTSVSVGAAEHRAEEPLESWVARADRALYTAKQAGRDRVAVDGATAFPTWDTTGRSAPLALLWETEYACGDATVDAQHEQLFALANELLEAAFAHRDGGASLVEGLDRLVAHLAAHFRDEEDVLAAIRWPGLEHHRVLHRQLLERARALRAEADAGAGSVGRLVEFLAFDGVATHLLDEDRAFFSAVAAAQR